MSSHHLSVTVTVTVTGVEHGMPTGKAGREPKPSAEPRSEAKIVMEYIIVLRTCEHESGRG